MEILFVIIKFNESTGWHLLTSNTKSGNLEWCSLIMWVSVKTTLFPKLFQLDEDIYSNDHSFGFCFAFRRSCIWFGIRSCHCLATTTTFSSPVICWTSLWASKTLRTILSSVTHNGKQVQLSDNIIFDWDFIEVSSRCKCSSCCSLWFSCWWRWVCWLWWSTSTPWWPSISSGSSTTWVRMKTNRIWSVTTWWL